MPVESSTGVCSLATSSRYGRLVISPEGTLISGRPRVPRNCTLGMSNGAERYWMPMESQYSFSSLCPSKEKCSLRIISSWLSAASVVCFWYSAFSANLLTTSSGTAVWYFTMSAPHSLAVKAIFLAISRSPLWLTPASAMMVTGIAAPPYCWLSSLRLIFSSSSSWPISIQLLSLMGYTPTFSPAARYRSITSGKPIFSPSRISSTTRGSTT